MEQRFTFNDVASLYDATRPGYPDVLFEDCIAAAKLKPGERIVEIGSGTGKATEGFARRGFAITAIEPGAQMIAAAKKSLAQYADIRFVQSTFETWTPEVEALALAVAAQSWHWVDPAVSFAKAAQALRPAGVLAVFGNVPSGMPADLRENFRQIYARLAPEIAIESPAIAYRPDGPFEHMFDASGFFGTVTHKSYPWRWPCNAQSYTGFLNTLSEHRLMDAEKREALLSAVADAITAHGGAFETEWEAHLYWARRKSS